jgi:hypothetical protein
MNPLQCSSLGIQIDAVLAGRDTAPSLFTSHDLSGRNYLVAQIGRDVRSVTWLCAPISPLALRCVVEGRVDPLDALQHSATGAVDRVTVAADGDHSLAESVQLCRDLGDELADCGCNWSRAATARCA